MSETLRITKASGVRMLREPKLALPVIAAAAVGYVLDLCSNLAQNAMVHRWVDGGMGSQSVLMPSVGVATLSRAQLITLEILARSSFGLVEAIGYALALVATIRIMRKNGEVTSGIPWRDVMGLALLLWLLSMAKSVAALSLAMTFEGIVSTDILQNVAPVIAALLQIALLWVVTPRAVRLAAAQGGTLQPEAEKLGQRVSVLTAVFITLIASINRVAAQFAYAHLNKDQVWLVSLLGLLIGVLPVAVLMIGLGLLTSREESNLPEEELA